MNEAPICKTCGTPLPPKTKRQFCNRACSNRYPGRISEVGLQRLRDSKTGDKNPARRQEVAAKISQHHKESGRFAGPNHPGFKGEWIANDEDGKPRYYMWIDEDTRRALKLKRPYTLRSRLVWLRTHPGEILKRHEIIHHRNGDTLDDSPDNLEKLINQEQHAKLHRARGDFEPKRKRSPDIPCTVCGAPIRPWRRFCSVECSAKGLAGPNNPNYGRRNSDEAIERMRQTKIGKKASAETRVKMSAARIAYWNQKQSVQNAT